MERFCLGNCQQRVLTHPSRHAKNRWVVCVVVCIPSVSSRHTLMVSPPPHHGKGLLCTTAPRIALEQHTSEFSHVANPAPKPRNTMNTAGLARKLNKLPLLPPYPNNTTCFTICTALLGLHHRQAPSRCVCKVFGASRRPAPVHRSVTINVDNRV